MSRVMKRAPMAVAAAAALLTTGSPGVAAQDEPCGRRRVGRLVHEMRLIAVRPKSFKPRTTDSGFLTGSIRGRP